MPRTGVSAQRHKARPIYRVPSKSRPGLFHTVDLDGGTCTCEYRIYHPWCDHLRWAANKEKELYG